MLKRALTLITDKVYSLPVVILMPHSRCNCRCVMCDIWKANHEKKEISLDDLQRHVQAFVQLNVREIVFSGGEALMHSNLWNLCMLLKEHKIKLTLLSTGLLLEKNATEVVNNFDEVIVSVDGSSDVHNRIRNIPNAYGKLLDGILALRRCKKNYKVTGRCVLQRANYADFTNIVRGARDIGLDHISFLPADVSTSAFNRPEKWDDSRVHEVALSRDETIQFEQIIQQSFASLKEQYDSHFIAESPEKMNRIVQYYKAVNGIDEYPPTVCNAPWVSAVIESDGSVMPCFFHKAYGNIFDNNFLDIINSATAISFRKNLKVNSDPVCRKCVCSLKLPVTQMR